MQTPSNDFETAQSLVRAGRLAEAERLCRQILGAQPRHGPALHLLSTIALQAGQASVAIRCLTAAIRIDGGQARFHATLGEAYRSLGQLHQAVTCYRQALRLQPDFAEGHNNLGTLYSALGDLPAATACFREAVRLQSRYFLGHQNLAIALHGSGDLPGAAEHFAAALRLQPGHHDAALRLGQVRLLLDQPQGVEALFRTALAARPDSWEALCEVGAVCQREGRLEEAIRLYRQAIACRPEFAVAHYNLGVALLATDQVSDAIASFEAAVRVQGDLREAWIGLAGVYTSVVRPDEAVSAARRVLALDPSNARAAMYLAGGLQMQGRIDDALAAQRHVVELDASSAAQHSNLLYTLNFHPAYSPAVVLAEHRAWAARHAEPLTAQAGPHGNERNRQRRLRVGYVSSHFRHHAVSFFAEPLIVAHDPAQVEVFCYADVPKPDEVTARLQSRADGWRDIAGQSDAQVAEQVRADQIDILVDLAGHIGGNRLLVFARKPAPVQVTYLGYQNTTGMTAMAYRLTDGHCDPPGTTDACYTEKLFRLPGSFFCFQPPEPAPAVNELPALAKGHITFASLNHIPKLTGEALDTWGEILLAVPDARLILLAYSPGQLENDVWERMRRLGVDPGRVTVTNKRPRYDYLALHHEIDIALDTFPFNGHTTVCDALWMGVPSIMMEGATYASRFGGSTLVCLGLTELIAHNRLQYVELAVDLANDLDRLKHLRASLRLRLASSPLVDAAGFARKVEIAFRQMWQAWCDRPHESIQ
jgi:predicted O-linked N-acetylglucosamine transferase (SPINDLY family)